MVPEGLGDKLQSVLPAVGTYAKEIGVPVSGPPFTRVFGFDAHRGVLDVEVGLPVTRRAEGRGDIQPSELPGGPAASVWHLGSHDGLPETHRALLAWSMANGHPLSGASWEIYVTDPRAEPDQSKWRTRVVLHLEP